MMLDSRGNVVSIGWSRKRNRRCVHIASPVTGARYARTMRAFPRIHSPYHYGVQDKHQERKQVEVQK